MSSTQDPGPHRWTPDEHDDCYCQLPRTNRRHAVDQPANPRPRPRYSQLPVPPEWRKDRHELLILILLGLAPPDDMTDLIEEQRTTGGQPT